MKNMKIKDICVPAIALFVICLVASVLLAVTNNITKQKIADNAVAAVQSSLSQVVEASDFSEAKDCGDGVEYYEAYDNDKNLIAYVFNTSAKGYGGDVKVMVAYDLEGTITGFTVVDCADETPGLGQNSKTHFTKDFFNGKNVSDSLAVVKDGGDIQAITAATITSRAVVKAINQANEAFANIGSNSIVGGADAPQKVIVKGGEE